MTFTYVSFYEIDRREPDLKTLLLIATIGGVSLNWLSERIDVSIDKAHSYINQEWYDLIDLAVDCNITPGKLRKLINAALALQEK